MQLTCAFVFAYAKSRLSHDVAHYDSLTNSSKNVLGLNPLPLHLHLPSVIFSRKLCYKHLLHREFISKQSRSCQVKDGSLTLFRISHLNHSSSLLTLQKLYLQTQGQIRCIQENLSLGFQPGPTQTRLYSHSRWLDA